VKRRNGLALLPKHSPGMKIGLLGGSFNPPHEGHRLASLIALRRLNLDCIWWLVTPGNPLKQNSDLPALATRLQACTKLAHHPAIFVSGVEAEIGTRFTYDTLRYLTQRCGSVDFVWLMGADNLATFHRWYRWRDIARLMPLAVIDRPGSTLRATHSQAALYMEKYRKDETDSALLAHTPAPALLFVHGPRSAQSSTALRTKQRLGARQTEI
jgi:nicotinate-nucleotide adenylyltransferase